MTKLTDKQELFCREYVIDLNATQAAIRAGYSEKTANRIASSLLSKVDIQSFIQSLKSERAVRTQINADYVLNRLVEIDQMDVIDILNDDMTIKPLAEWPLHWRRTISGVDLIYMSSKDDIETVLKKIKWPDKVKNLELIGKHVAVQAFTDKVDLSSTDGSMSPVGAALTAADLTDEQLAAIITNQSGRCSKGASRKEKSEK